jgi:DNA polymerase/3'-5' exonuclease PolX
MKARKPAKDTLTDIYGIGPGLAAKILTEGIAGHKIDPTKLLRPQLKKYAEYLPEATRADLKYNPSRKIPHAVIARIDKLLQKHLVGFKFNIAGSYRRNKPFSRDIDIIISAPSTKSTADHWKHFLTLVPKSIVFLEPYAQGADKVSTMLQFGGYTCKVDVFFTDPKEYMFMLLYATGSGIFNIRMRATAKRLGYLLNQRGLYKRVSPSILRRVPIRDEKALFKKLKMRYLEPHQRIK